MKKLFSQGLAMLGMMFASVSAFAIDTLATGTAITAAKADGLTVGEQVIAAVAGLVIIGVVIAMVRKL